MANLMEKLIKEELDASISFKKWYCSNPRVSKDIPRAKKISTQEYQKVTGKSL